MLDPRQFLVFVIRPTLRHIGMEGLAAERLVLGTGIAESRLTYVDQVTRLNDTRLGPALGLFQMEPATHDDIWNNWLVHRPNLMERLNALLAPHPDKVTQLVCNLSYTVAMCRILYRRVPQPLPGASDALGMAEYHKRFYNTYLGAARVEETVHGFRQAVQMDT